VDGEVDATGGEGVLDFLDEDAGAVGGEAVERRSVRVGRGRGERGVLHAVADGADHLDLDLMAKRAQLTRDVIGLPQRKLRSARSDAKGG
jgi:hypothetical protein